MKHSSFRYCMLNSYYTYEMPVNILVYTFSLSLRVTSANVPHGIYFLHKKKGIKIPFNFLLSSFSSWPLDP